MSHPRHLSHVQGLRAVAIAAIILYHLQPQLCPCGYFGVDVFLVITGYFLARNDAPRLRDGEMGAGDFLLRKAWRIMPPWMAVALIVCVGCPFIMGYTRLAPVFATAGSAALCFSNEYVAYSGGYFSPAVQENPLMHLWYIGLTLQIYLLTPCVAWLVRRFRAWGPRLLILVFALSLLLHFVLTEGQAIVWLAAATDGVQDWINPYYSLLTRAWEPLLGAAMACMAPPAAGHSAKSGVLSAAGFVLLLAPMYLLETGSNLTYAAAAATCLLLRYGTGPLLSCAPLRTVGGMSYSLYLAHWPVFVIWKYVCYNEPGTWGYVGMLLLACLSGYMLWRFVESRCRSWADARSKKGYVRIPLAAMLTIGAVGLPLGLISPLEYVWPSVIPYSTSGRIHILADKAPEQDLQGFDTSAFPQKPLTIGTAKAPASFALVGDSHAWHLVDGLTRCCNEKGVRGVFLNNTCVPAWNYSLSLDRGNAHWNEAQARALLRWLEAQKDIRCVVISVHWNWRLNSDDGRDWDFNPISLADSPERMRQGVLEMCRRIRALGKEIIVLHDTPNFPQDEVSPFDEEERSLYLHRPCPERAVTRERYQEINKEASPLFQALEEEGIAHVMETASVLERDGRYPFKDTDGRFLYRDTNHLSTHGSLLVAQHIFHGVMVHSGLASPIPPEISCRDHQYAPDPKPEDVREFDTGVFTFPLRSLGTADVPAGFVVIGDSHAWHLAHGLRECCDEAGMRGLFLNNSCLPAWNAISVLNDGKEIWDEPRTHALLHWLEAHPEIRCVVISNRWEVRLPVSDAQDWNHTPLPYAQAPEHLRQGIVEMCRRLRAIGKEVIVLKDTPSFPDAENPNARAILHFKQGTELSEQYTTRAYYDKVNAVAAPLFRELEEQGLAHIVDMAPALESDGKYPFRDTDGRFFYRDTNHLSAHGSRAAARHLFPFIRACVQGGK